jgi:phosphatidylserine decarboxylase
VSALVWLAVAIVALLIIVYVSWRVYFLRDPDRSPAETSGILAPADGYVMYVRDVAAGQVPVATKKNNDIRLSEVQGDAFQGQEGLLIGIFMTPFSVHVNRAPIAGTVESRVHFRAGPNLSMVRPLYEILVTGKPATEDHLFQKTNERLTTGIKTAAGTLFVVQIADSWIDRIVSWAAPGEPIGRGDRIGMIRFGSQCDVFIPKALVGNVTIEKGQYVYAGQTVLASTKAN